MQQNYPQSDIKSKMNEMCILLGRCYGEREQEILKEKGLIIELEDNTEK